MFLDDHNVTILELVEKDEVKKSENKGSDESNH